MGGGSAIDQLFALHRAVLTSSNRLFGKAVALR